jgi:ATP-dependent DNA helicase RecG
LRMKGSLRKSKPLRMKKAKDEGRTGRSDFSPKTTKDTSVQYIKGVGPARARLLERLDLKTLEDILYHFPRRYEDRKNLRKISDLKFGSQETTVGRIVSAATITTRRKRMKIFEITVSDDSGLLVCRWFNQPYLKQYLKEGYEVVLNVTVKGGLGSAIGFEMENPDFELIGKEDKFIHTSRIVPFHSATEGLKPKQLRTLIFNTVNGYINILHDHLPEEILKRNGLKPLQWSIKEAHFPEDISDINELNSGVSPAHKRLIFDEFFLLELGLALMKRREKIEKGISFKDRGDLVNGFLKGLPFELTGAQKRVIEQIDSDMKKDVPMNRLVHGDVGCGKTVVALVSMLNAVDNGYQACLMAPTELLAEQHYINIHRMTEGLGLKTALLTSSTKGRPLEDIASGAAKIIIGTHALIQESVEFRALGLAVIDEQHRFGVVQRAVLRRKGDHPDILIMTATPIPRTLALTLYGDLDISIIDELPSGRKPIRTRIIFSSHKDEVYSRIESEISKGRQAYIVYPLIEGSEKTDLKSAMDGAEALKKKFPGRKIELVHGKVARDERESIMDRFKSGDIDILVATTVIEVGIDVPNASLMLIVHAERFGLAQLHQLRGRTGRGDHESHCLLLAYHPFSEEAKRRLKAMELTGDGFRIAEEDLAIRGPGEFFGTKQSGIPDLSIADIIRDIAILENARREAFELADSDPDLKQHPLLREALDRRWKGRLELVKS